MGTDQTTVNRATLHFAPLVAIWVVLVFSAFAARWRATHPARNAGGGAPAAAAAVPVAAAVGAATAATPDDPSSTPAAG